MARVMAAASHLLEEASATMQRGHCQRCGQQWVLGKIEPNLGEYGLFFCGACWDEADDNWSTEVSMVTGRARKQQKRLRVTTPWHHEEDFKPGNEELPEGLSLHPVRIGWHGRARIFRAVTDSLQQHFRSCGASIWMGSKVLLNFLEQTLVAKRQSSSLQGIRVLELGAGCGLTGIGLGQLGAEVVLTDLPEMCPLLELNVMANFPPLPSLAVGCMANAQAPRVAPLRWGNEGDLKAMRRAELPDSNFDYVIGSDICYDPRSLPLLLSTLEALTRLGDRGAPRVFLLCSRRQGEVEDFERCCARRGWTTHLMEEVDLEALRGDPTCSVMDIVELLPPIGQWNCSQSFCQQYRRPYHRRAVGSPPIAGA